MKLTRTLMRSSALLLGASGLSCTFAPGELLLAIGSPVSEAVLLGAQILGALYLGFGGLNWMSRDNVIGGIYSRPLVIGNLIHFLVAGIAIIKIVAQDPTMRGLWPVAVLYALFAAGFSIALFLDPAADQSPR